jgi:ribosome biogenesis GTPase
MRELQLADVEAGIEDVFADVMALAGECRFADCRHESEPGCAVRGAIADGRLDAARLDRFRKLSNEAAEFGRTLEAPRTRTRLRAARARVLKDKRDKRGE